MLTAYISHSKILTFWIYQEHAVSILLQNCQSSTYNMQIPMCSSVDATDDCIIVSNSAVCVTLEFWHPWMPDQDP